MPMRTLILLSIALLISGQAQGWGKLGHRVVGEIAEARLNAPARAAVAELLRGEAEPSLAGIANWADELRDNNPDLGKRSSRWHYLNFPRPMAGATADACHYEPARDCRDGDCVVAAIETQRRILADRRQPSAARLQALKFVVHFVGDVHQPLHAGYADDLGGNTAQLRYGGEGTNLHRVWDHWIIQASGYQDAAAYAAHLATQSAAAVDDERRSGAPVWAEESCRIVKQPGFYPAKRRLPAAYITHYRPVVEQRLRQAGVRLADLLNQTLGRRGS